MTHAMLFFEKDEILLLVLLEGLQDFGYRDDVHHLLCLCL